MLGLLIQQPNACFFFQVLLFRDEENYFSIFKRKKNILMVLSGGYFSHLAETIKPKLWTRFNNCHLPQQTAWFVAGWIISVAYRGILWDFMLWFSFVSQRKSFIIPQFSQISPYCLVLLWSIFTPSAVIDVFYQLLGKKNGCFFLRDIWK